MLDMVHEPATPAELKARLLNDIASFTLPRIKPIEFTEAQRMADEAISALAQGEREQIDTFIEAFLNGRLSAGDLSSLVSALSLKQKPQGQVVLDEQAELLRLIKGWVTDTDAPGFLKTRSGLFPGETKGPCVIVHSSEREGLDGGAAGFETSQRLGDNVRGRDLLALGHRL
jgi:hypothetical protein